MEQAGKEALRAMLKKIAAVAAQLQTAEVRTETDLEGARKLVGLLEGLSGVTLGMKHNATSGLDIDSKLIAEINKDVETTTRATLHIVLEKMALLTSHLSFSADADALTLVPIEVTVKSAELLKALGIATAPLKTLIAACL